MAVITLTETKTLLQITSTDYDALIAFLIPMIEDEIKTYCNQEFVDAPLTPSWEVWMKLPVSKMIANQINNSLTYFNGMKSESQGGYSYTKDDSSSGSPLSLMSAFDKARMANVGRQSIKSQYRDTRGWTAEELVLYTPIEGIDGIVEDEE